MKVVAILIFLTLLVLPALAIAGVSIWARRVSQRPGMPRFVSWIAYVLAAPAGLALTFVLVHGLVMGLGAAATEEPVEPSQKARVLAESISEVMNSGAFGLGLALIAWLWLTFSTWRWRRAVRCGKGAVGVRRPVILVLGAGASFGARQAGEKGTAPPLGNELAEYLLGWLDLNPPNESRDDDNDPWGVYYVRVRSACGLYAPAWRA